LVEGDDDALVEDRTGVAIVDVAEQAHDAQLPLPAAGEGGVDDALEDGEQPTTGVTDRVEGTRLDQRLDRSLVEHHRIDPLAEVVEVGEWSACFPLGHDAADEALAHGADGRETEGDTADSACGS